MELRAMRPDDAEAVADVWADAVPYLVRTARTAAYGLDRAVVAAEAGAVFGHGTFHPDQDGTARLALVVRRAARGRGTGSALLTVLEDAARLAGVHVLVGVADEDGRSPRFAAERGYDADGAGRFSGCDPHRVPDPGPPPEGVHLVPLDVLAAQDGIAAVWRAHQATAEDDPSGLTPRLDLETWRREFWHYPDHDPALGVAAVVPGTGDAEPEVASYTMTQADPDRHRIWSTMTGTPPPHRGRGLAHLVKATALRRAAARGYTTALTANDVANAPMLAVNDRLGYREVARALTVRRTL